MFYIASRDTFIKEAKYCAQSVKENTQLETILYTNVATKEHSSIDQIRILPKRKHKLWYLDSVRYMNHIVEELKEYDQLLYLDVDTYISYPCLDMFRLLEHHDMALGHAAGRDVTVSALKVPPSWTTLAVGVNLFKNSEKVRAFFRDWYDLYNEHKDIYLDTDEAPLRDLLYINKPDVKVAILPPEYHLRFGFGCWLFGRARILHGRVSTPLKEIGEQINAETGMRVWKDKLVWYWSTSEGNVYA